MTHNFTCPIKINLNLVIFDYQHQYHCIQSIVLIIDEIKNYFFTSNNKRNLGIMPNFSISQAVPDLEIFYNKIANQKYSSIINAPIFGGFGAVSSLRSKILQYQSEQADKEKNQLIQNYDVNNYDVNNYDVKNIGWDTKLFLQNSNAFVVNGSNKQSFQSIALPNMYIILLKPNCQIATPYIFHQYHKEGKNFDKQFDIHKDDNFNFSDLCQLLQQTGNSLEENIKAHMPIMRSILSVLRASVADHGYCGITGTGSGIFTICQSQDIANKIYNISTHLAPWVKKIYWTA